MILNNNLIFGNEFEGHFKDNFTSRNNANYIAYGNRYKVMAKGLKDRGIDYVLVTQDASENVDFEVVFPPMANCEIARQKIERVFKAIIEIGGDCIKTNCGNHIHIGIRPIKDNITNEEFTLKSIENFKNHLSDDLLQFSVNETLINPRYVTPNQSRQIFLGNDLRQNHYGDVLPFALLKDVVYAYAKNQKHFNKLVSKSRRNNRMCYPIDGSHSVRYNILDNFNWESCLSVSECNSILGGKFACINVSHFTSKETFEFRQHQASLSTEKIFNWITLLMNLFYVCDEHRIDHNLGNATTTQTVDAPNTNPYRRFTLKAKIWDMCKSALGSSVSDIMNSTNTTYANVRSRISEIRNDYNGIVQTIDQTQYGSNYGDGNGLGGYKILNTYKILANTSKIRLLPQDERGGYNLFIGLNQELKQWFHSRMNLLNR